VFDPFGPRHELKQEIQHRLPPPIKKMSAPDIKRRPIHCLGPAQAAPGRFLLEQNKRCDPRLLQPMRKSEASRPPAENAITHLNHPSTNGAASAIIQRLFAHWSA
jgi:hypothetical protein